ncbi:uncharacterized protein si:ch211-198p11.6 [Mobula hypostoma]|uniref:uncharacterized protein si:ch211-198p11.6 n=1 Tax=Mobula hypostoma TaxID=723540 RepID=UPI002FC3068F
MSRATHPSMAPLTMRSPVLVTVAPPQLLIPLPAIIILVVGVYLVLVVMAVIVRQWLLAQGVCGESNCGGLGEDSPCGQCLLTLAQSCDCRLPTLTKCMDHCCPRSLDCGRGNCPCCPLCDCACAFQLPDCETTNCICFEIKLR